MNRSIRELALGAGLLLLLLALTGGAAPRSAASGTTVAVVRWDGKPPAKICPGFVYDIEVHVTDFPPAIISWGAPPVRTPSTTVLAEVNETSGAKFGALLELRKNSGSGGPALFRYYPRTPGKESLTFDAKPMFSPGTTVPAFPRPFTFDVTDCKLKAEMIYDLRWDVGSGAMVIGTGIMDEVEVTADEDGNLHGAGAMVYSQIITGFPECALSWTSLTSDVTVTGQAGGDQINLNFAFGDGSVTGQAICPEASVSSTQNLNPGSGFASSITFPSEGGVMTYPSPSPVGGTVYVIVTRDAGE
jgi:hypothetical protein